MQAENFKRVDGSSIVNASALSNGTLLQYEKHLNEILNLNNNPETGSQSIVNIREKLLLIIQSLEDKKDYFISSSETLALSSIIDAVNHINQKVLTTADSTIDSRILKLTADIANEKIKILDNQSNTNVFDIGNLIRKIFEYTGSFKNPNSLLSTTKFHSETTRASSPLLDFNDFHLEKLGELSIKYSKAAHCIDFLLGPIALPPKAKLPKRQKKTGVSSLEIVPRTMKLEEADLVKDSTSERVAFISRILEKVGPINFFQFIIQPEMFSKSVENLFHCSFLIREGQASLSLSEDGQPIIEACDTPTEKDYQEGLCKKQLIMDFSMDIWRKAIHKYNIIEATIPN